MARSAAVTVDVDVKITPEQLSALMEENARLKGELEALSVLPAAVESISEITIPQSERESVDNDFFIFRKYVDGPIKRDLFSGTIPKGDVTVTITVRK